MNNPSLYLDIWVPPNATSTSNLPLKVWIYGGGQQGGGIQDPQFNGCNLAVHDTLLVSISYLLGPLGYLTQDSAGIGGNFGVQDLILGLEWVQSNIASFGGDPVSISHPVPMRGVAKDADHNRTEKSSLVRRVCWGYERFHP
jgi:carboxylesterase type B